MEGSCLPHYSYFISLCHTVNAPMKIGADKTALCDRKDTNQLDSPMDLDLGGHSEEIKLQLKK